MGYLTYILNGYNSIGVIIALLCWLVLLLLANPVKTYNFPKSNNYSNRVGVGFVFFSSVCILGLHRWDSYHMIDWVFSSTEHMEPLQEWILVTLSNGNLFIYRIIIFGGSSFLLFYIAKRLKIYNRNFLLVCTVFLLDSYFCEMRGTFGHMVLTLGFVLLVEKNTSITNKIFGLLLISLSFFLHRSIFICIIFVILSLFNFSKKRIIILSWVFFPLMVIIVNRYFSNIVQMLSAFDLGDMGISETVETYGESDLSFGQYSMIGNIVRVICTGFYYAVWLYITITICLKRVYVENVYVYLFRLYYICMYIGLLFSFTEVTDWLSRRIMVMAWYPMPFLITRLWCDEVKASTWTKIILIWGIIGGALSMLMRYSGWSA